MMPSKPDIWMPLYIGDYLAATTHLSAEQSGAYLHLLMHQWKNGALPLDSESLRRIARVERDAWSIVQASLEHFFDFPNGRPVQLNLERIRNAWQEKKMAAVEKARTAAEKRWSKGSADAPSIAQAMPRPCPSPTPSSVSTKKPSRAKREGGLKDDRHVPFKLAFEVYYRHRAGRDAPWDGREAKSLSSFLAANPAWTLADWQSMLQNRGHSDVAHGENLSQWIHRAPAFAESPLDRFGKRLEAPHGTVRSNGYRNRDQENMAAAKNFLSRIDQAADGVGDGETGDVDGSGVGDLLRGAPRLLAGRPEGGGDNVEPLRASRGPHSDADASGDGYGMPEGRTGTLRGR